MFYVFCSYNYTKYEVAKKKMPKTNFHFLKFGITSKWISQLLKFSPPNIIINTSLALNMSKGLTFFL